MSYNIMFRCVECDRHEMRKCHKPDTVAIMASWCLACDQNTEWHLVKDRYIPKWDKGYHSKPSRKSMIEKKIKELAGYRAIEVGSDVEAAEIEIRNLVLAEERSNKKKLKCLKVTIKNIKKRLSKAGKFL